MTAETTVPADLCKIIAAAPKAQWSTLTPDERRDFVVWVNSVKGSDERRERVEKACLTLASGKRRP